LTIFLCRRNKHSSYSSSFPIYLFTQKEIEVPDEDASETASADEEKPTETEETTETEKTEADEDEAVVEDVTEEEKEEKAPPKMKKVVVDEWVQLNAQAPIWTR
jgi:heat shock protein beta